METFCNLFFAGFSLLFFLLPAEVTSDYNSEKKHLVEKQLIQNFDPASDTIFVAPPVGQQETDRESIQSAFDAVQPGGVVQFRSGIYLLGAGARLTVPDVTILGHREGTVLRGCDPEKFKVEKSEMVSVVFGCAGFYIQAERQTIHGLTFEFFWEGIVAGPYPTSLEQAMALGERGDTLPNYPVGGQNIEGNTFRDVVNGLRMMGIGNGLSIVRNNDFIDVFHAIGIYGPPLHFLENRITVKNPEGVPFSQQPASVIVVSPGHTDCAGHVVAENLIVGYPDPIYVLVSHGETCRGVEIRINIIHAARVKVPKFGGFYNSNEKDSTMVGVPITLMNKPEPMPGMPETDTVGVLKNILVQGNKIYGAEGLGILVQNVSHSQITNNTISGTKLRTPFPGITWDGIEHEWGEANGSGIWVSTGSTENEVTGNTFEDIASYAVFLEGDSTLVELRKINDSVKNHGNGNRINIKKDDGVDLRETIKKLDSLYFEAYNKCDMDAFAKWHSEDLEVIHGSVGGIRGKDEFLEIIRTKLCTGDVEKRRELISGTLEVHQLVGTGALEIVKNRYFIKLPDGKEIEGEGKMILVWRNTGDEWKVFRIYSL